MNITRTKLPTGSALNIPGKKYDYTDSYASYINDPDNKIGPDDLGNAFFSSSPAWVGYLFKLRNSVVSLFGLKTSDRVMDGRHSGNVKYEPGAQIGLFKMYSRSENEIVLGQDDRHLNFRVSLYIAGQNKNSPERCLTVSTTVEYNNLAGRIYFLPVKPFHKIIVKKTLSTMTLYTHIT